MVNQTLTDWQRMKLAQLEYYDWKVDDEVVLPDGTVIGQVVKIIATADGFRATVIQSTDTEIAVLFRGSSGVRKGDPTTWTNEWLRVNLPIGDAIIHQVPTVPDEMWTAVQSFNQLLASNPHTNFYIYGHSLGSINAQFALANCRYPQQIQHADLYEGPNIYWLLSEQQRRVALNLRTRIFNYIDPFDVIALGYLDRQHTIGLLQVVDSNMTSPINQHMWGGYQFDRHQRLKLVPQSAHLRRAILDQRLIQRFAGKEDHNE